MRKLICSLVVAATATIAVPAVASAQEIPPQPHPDCVLIYRRPLGWFWLCPAGTGSALR